MEERKLILLLKQGSKDAFTALYKQYWKQVYNFSRLYLTSADAAEEVVQEVLSKYGKRVNFFVKMTILKVCCLLSPGI